MTNKEIAPFVHASLLAGNFDDAFRHVADDVYFTVNGSLPLSGTHQGKEKLKQLFSGFNGNFAGGLKPEFPTVFGEGDYVCLEMRLRGTSHKGKNYDNNYALIYEIKDGKVRHIRAYLDFAKYVEATS